MPFSFDYTELHCFIKKHFQSQNQFAQFLGISAEELQARLDNEIPFTQREIDLTVCYATNKILTANQIVKLFFTHRVKKIDD